MRVQRRVLRAVWLQVVGTRAGFGAPIASLLVSLASCPTIQAKIGEHASVLQDASDLSGHLHWTLIEPYRCPATRGVGREVSGQASKKGLRERGAATTRQNRGGHAVNAAIRTLPAAVQRRRRANPVVDGQLVPKKRAPRKRRREEDAGVPCAICFDPTTVTLVCGHAMCEECMGRLAVFQGQTVTRFRRRVVIRCPLRCDAPTERVLA